MSVESKIAFLPGGEMNTALALKAHGNGHRAIIWYYSGQSYRYFQETHESPKLKGFKLSGIEGTHDIREALKDAAAVSFASRSWDFRDVIRAAKPYLGENTILLTNVKGFDEYEGQYYTPSQVIEQEVPDSRDRIAVLSGPNFAEQIASGKITGTTVAAYNHETAQRVKDIFHNGLFWVDLYQGNPIDVEIVGAYKNVVGLVMGFAHAIPGYGENTGAFILQKGLQEAALLCKAMGGNLNAIMELCGIGDFGFLMNSFTSRNVKAGYQFGRGEMTTEDLMNPELTIEGMRTVKAVRALSLQYRVFMPLTRIVYKVLYGEMDSANAVRRLLLRNS